ncbi:MAG: cell division protein ZapA [Calditrichota bacterium]
MTADNIDMRSDGDRETTVRVTILGQEYPVRAHADADYIREIAAALDLRMRMIQQTEPERPPLKIAVLAALNLIDEVFSLKREKVELADRYERKVRDFTEHLNRGLLE